MVFDPDRKKTQWQRFEAEVVRLNRLDEFVTQYKVLFLGRHGQGYHNLAESLYGTEAWDCYWSRKTGNNDISWIDSELTPLGVSQALDVHNFWAQMIELEKIPTPQSYYTSPLLRCQQTAFHTFSGLAVPSERPFNPVIKELLRETIGVHTCDKRSTKSTIQARYPDWTVEDGFTETDELWSPSLRESRGALDQRSKVILDDILGNDENQFLSISSHGGLIGSILSGESIVMLICNLIWKTDAFFWRSTRTQRVRIGYWRGDSSPGQDRSSAGSSSTGEKGALVHSSNM